MTDLNLALYVGSYADAASAKEDFDDLRAAQGDDFDVMGAVVMSRAADGTVDVLGKGTGEIAAGSLIGGGVGLLVGLFAPPLLAATAVGAGIGAVAGELTKKHEEKKLGVDLEEYLPPNSSAVVVVLDNRYLDRVEHSLTRADKRVSKAIDSGDYSKLQKALDKSGEEIADAVDS